MARGPEFNSQVDKVCFGNLTLREEEAQRNDGMNCAKGDLIRDGGDDA